MSELSSESNSRWCRGQAWELGWGGVGRSSVGWELLAAQPSNFLSLPQGILLEAGRKQPLKLFIQSKTPGTISLLVSVSWGSGGGGAAGIVLS